MRAVAATSLAVAFLLALVFGAQTAEWSWGPALVALAVALAVGAFVNGEGGGRWVGWALVPATAWILGRGLTSDVLDYARADALLVGACVGTAVVVAMLRSGRRSLPILFAGLALVLLLNLGIGVVQSQHPEFMWPYHHRPSPRVTGFFGHYNYFACFSYGVGLLLAARGLFARDGAPLRILYLTTAVWSLAMVPVSGSRGGTLATAVGVMVLVGCGGVLAWRHGAWWSKLFLVAFPLLAVGVGVLGWTVLTRVQQQRQGDMDLSRLADNSARLEWVELALRVAADHPLAGGGSRAYSWESKDRWEVRSFGRGAVNERFVHNEPLQLLTDYGVVGLVVVLLPIGFVGWLALSRLFLGGGEEAGQPDSIAAGVLAAGAAMLTQSNFSFVFHLLPPAMLLGLILGFGAWLSPPLVLTSGGRLTRALTSGGIAIALAIPGVAATRTLQRVWPVLYAQTSLVYSNPGAAVDRLESAAGVWSGHRMLEEAGNFSRLAGSEAGGEEARQAWNRRAVDCYRRAIAWHPHHPGLELNLANALSELGRDQAAEEAYLRAIDLQGGLEAAF